MNNNCIQLRDASVNRPTVPAGASLLWTGIDGQPAGFVFGGRLAGPTLVAADHSDLAHGVAIRLGRLPSLPWMRGKIVIVSLDRLPTDTCDVQLSRMVGTIDRTIHLPVGSEETQETTVNAAYWQILDMAARIGMISGRGVRIH